MSNAKQTTWTNEIVRHLNPFDYIDSLSVDRICRSAWKLLTQTRNDCWFRWLMIIERIVSSVSMVPGVGT